MSGIRHLAFLLAFLGHPTWGTAQETEDVSRKLNPGDFVPLEVGNQWTFSHEYLNEMYFARDRLWPDIVNADQEGYWEPYFKQFEIPEYPMDGESAPPHALLRPDTAVLTVEITHTEHINGFEYFVFSEPSYTWPRMPRFFLAGEKVRLSQEGILLFHRNGEDIPLYDFGWFSLQSYRVTPASAFGYVPNEWGVDHIEVNPWMRDELTFPVYPYHLDVVKRPRYQDQFLEVTYRFDNAESVGDLDWLVQFVNGYGLGRFFREEIGVSSSPVYRNVLTPVSAVQSGETVSFEEAAGKLVLLVDPDLPPVVGERDTLFLLDGFDFSEGSPVPEWEEEVDLVLSQLTDHGQARSPFSFTRYKRGAHLETDDFARLVSEWALVDLRLFDEGRIVPKDGHIYAFQTQEGGTGLMHILDIVLRADSSVIYYILFDWVYYPPSDKPTSIESTSWGAVKNSFYRGKHPTDSAKSTEHRR